MPKLVCVTCEIELKPECNGTLVVETARFGPCKLWHADMWKCPACGKEIVAGFGLEPIAEHYEPNFADIMREETKIARRVVYDNERPKKAVVVSHETKPQP